MAENHQARASPYEGEASPYEAGPSPHLGNALPQPRRNRKRLNPSSFSASSCLIHCLYRTWLERAGLTEPPCRVSSGLIVPDPSAVSVHSRPANWHTTLYPLPQPPSWGSIPTVGIALTKDCRRASWLKLASGRPHIGSHEVLLWRPVTRSHFGLHPDILLLGQHVTALECSNRSSEVRMPRTHED